MSGKGRTRLVQADRHIARSSCSGKSAQFARETGGVRSASLNLRDRKFVRGENTTYRLMEYFGGMKLCF